MYPYSETSTVELVVPDVDLDHRLPLRMSPRGAAAGRVVQVTVAMGGAGHHHTGHAHTQGQEGGHCTRRGSPDLGGERE